MGKIFCLIGKSSCGKDTLYKRILSDGNLPLKTLVSYTTRPIRSGETNGVEYYFLTEDQLKSLEQEDKIIELRAYHTVHGIWKYFTVNDHQIDLAKHDYLVIGTLESFQKLHRHLPENDKTERIPDSSLSFHLQASTDTWHISDTSLHFSVCTLYLHLLQPLADDALHQMGILHRLHNLLFPWKAVSYNM